MIRAIPAEGYRIIEVVDMASVGESQKNDDIRLILADVNVPGRSFQDFIILCRRRFPAAEIILLVDRTRRSAACEAMRMGASDFIVMPSTDEEIEVRSRKAMTWVALRDEAAGLHRRMAMDFGFDNFIGISEAAADVRHRAGLATDNESVLAIVGETASGRGHLARIIHHHGRRRAEPIRVYDAAADSGSIREDDGAGTVIIRNAEVFIEQNPHDLDALLNGPKPYRLVLLGTPKILELISARKIPAIVIPPLRSRPEDIPALTEYFLRRIGDRTGRPVLTVAPEAMRRLIRYEWPGNVGELEQTLSTAAALAAGDTITTDHFIFLPSGDATSASGPETLSTWSLEEVERTQILRSLEGNGWNFSQTAQQLGIGRTTLWRKIKKYHLTQAATV
ncbi:MAG: sigma-54-dependent Fis family transcriptional regulator [candidate division Zixibacteria bacterium]|nr:sigma-54-dependent Fis family transcriptional regulator [candidate division Zixibacteria bacterium]